MSGVISHWISESGTFVIWNMFSKITLFVGIISFVLMGVCLDYRFESFVGNFLLMIIFSIPPSATTDVPQPHRSLLPAQLHADRHPDSGQGEDLLSNYDGDQHVLRKKFVLHTGRSDPIPLPVHLRHLSNWFQALPLLLQREDQVLAPQDLLLQVLHQWEEEEWHLYFATATKKTTDTSCAPPWYNWKSSNDADQIEEKYKTYPWNLAQATFFLLGSCFALGTSLLFFSITVKRC